MKKIYIIIIIILVFLLGVLTGIKGSRLFFESELVAEWSSMKALHAHLAEKLEEYKNIHGKYPDTLSGLQNSKIPYRDLDGARPSMLKRIYYEGRGDSYILFWDESIYWEHKR
ncbi:hypothetical protein ES702_02085 [subsurface metagenome]